MKLQLVEKFKPSFDKNFETFKLQTIEEQVYSTKINKKIPTDYLKVINTLAREYLTNIDNIIFWDINVSIYATAVTIKQELNDLKKINGNLNTNITCPRWMIKFEDSIDRMRKEIGQIHTLINCKKYNTFIEHQLSLKNKFQNKYGNTKTRTLEYKLSLLKHDLKATCTKFKYSKRKHQRKIINRSFSKDPKGVYRNFRGTKINVENIQSKDEVESFCSVWCKNVTFNKDAPWINDLVVNYCKDAKQNAYSIDLKTLNTVSSIKSAQVKL